MKHEQSTKASGKAGNEAAAHFFEMQVTKLRRTPLAVAFIITGENYVSLHLRWKSKGDDNKNATLYM